MENTTKKPTETNKSMNPQSSKDVINQKKIDRHIEKLKSNQNLPLGFFIGLIASIVGAILWAAITVATEYQIGYMAIAIGLLVGYVIRYSGKGIDNIFGISGAVLSAFACLLGNFLSIIGFAANEEKLGYLETLRLIDYSIIPEIMVSTFNPIDVLFYGIAIYEGYKFSFRKISEDELLEVINN